MSTDAAQPATCIPPDPSVSGWWWLQQLEAVRSELIAAYDLGKRHATEWRPIADAPDEIKDGRTILAWDSFALEPTTIRWISDHWESCWDGSQVICSQSDFGTDYKDPGCPTHYMPLPPAPETMK